MIHAFVGTAEDNKKAVLRGTGKTSTMTAYLYYEKKRKNRSVLTNYYTDFSDDIDSCQNIIEKLSQSPEEYNEPICGFTEMHNIINSLGSKNKQILFITKFASQIRKLDCDALYDTQRFKDIHLRLQLHTDTIFIPEKRHQEDYSLCRNDRCTKSHYIFIYRYKPWFPRWIRKFDPAEIGQHYDTKQIVWDTLELSSKGA